MLRRVVQNYSLRVTIRPGFPGHVLFVGLCPIVRAVIRKLAVCRSFFARGHWTTFAKYVYMFIVEI